MKEEKQISEVVMFWKRVIDACDSLQQMDAVMFMASEDNRLTSAEYVALTLYCKDCIEQNDWLQ